MTDGAQGKRSRHTCLVCRRRRVRGTFIRHAFLCAACESRLIGLGVSDPAYDQFVAGLRRAWPEFRRPRSKSRLSAKGGR